MKKIFLFATLILLVFLSGCKTQNAINQNEFGLELESFIGGDGGLKIDFAQDSPPQKVMDMGLEYFSIQIIVENLGEYDIDMNQAFISITGFNPKDINMDKTSKVLQSLKGLKKTTTEIISGGKQEIVFDNLAYISSIVSGTYPLSLHANICYPYETRAFALVCINGDISSVGQDLKCQLDGNKLFINSAAPVAIENVKQNLYDGRSIQIEFDIVHKRANQYANIYERGTIDSDCNMGSESRIDFSSKKDKITYFVDIGLSGLDCEKTQKNTNTVKLTDDKYSVNCIVDMTGQLEYETQMLVVLKYDYFDSIQKNIIIEHVN